MKNQTQPQNKKLVGIHYLIDITGKSRATVYRWIDKGLLPKPRKFNERNHWQQSEIDEAVNNLMAG